MGIIYLDLFEVKLIDFINVWFDDLGDTKKLPIPIELFMLFKLFN